MLTQVADGVWVRQSEWVWTNTIVVRGDDGLILVDPGIDGSELSQLADDLDRLGIPIRRRVLHPSSLGPPALASPVRRRAALRHPRRCPRCQQSPRACAGDGSAERVGHPSRTDRPRHPLPEDGGPVPGEIIEHQAHAIGRAAVILADRGVLLAGDMLSDVLIPLRDRRQPDQVGAYETALDRLEEVARHVDVVVPATAPLPRVPRWRPASSPIMPTSTRCGEERNQSTRAWGRMPTGSPAPTNPTWSRPRPGRGLLLGPGFLAGPSATWPHD